MANAQQAWLSPLMVAAMLVIMGITPMLPSWSVKTEMASIDAAKVISSPDAQLASHRLHGNQEINMITAIFEWTNTPHFPSSMGFFLLQQTNNLGN